MAKGSGSRKTPERVVRLIRDQVDKSSQSAVAKNLGIGVAAVNRYISGIGEPTNETLQKMSIFFKRPVWWLRGDSPFCDDAQLDNLEKIQTSLETIISWKNEDPNAAADAETMRKLVERMYEWTIEGTSYNAVQDMLNYRKKHKAESKE